MKNWQLLLVLILLGTLCRSAPAPAQAAPALVLYGTFEAMGVTVNLSGTDDPDLDATTLVEYRQSGSGTYQQGFPLSRVNATRFVGSLFWLTPGVTYDVRVTFTDPDGGALNGAVVSASKSTRAEIAIPAATKSYYASPTGSGTSCTQAAPCSLASAIGQAQAGQAVVLRGGTYYEGEIDLPNSGQAGAPIMIRNYPGEIAIFDGGDPNLFTWESQGNGIYRAAINVQDTHLVTANGQRLYPYQSLDDLQNLIWGIPGFYANGGDVFVRLANDVAPNPETMVISRYNNALTVRQDYIYILGLTFRHYGQGEYAKAVYLDTASYNLIKDCTFVINDLSIGIKRPSGENVIEDNTFSDTIFDWPWDAVKAGSGLETGGVRFYDPVEGQGTIIRRNVFHDFFDGFGACPNESGGLTNETDVYDNLVYRAGDDGMETDGQCSNVRIWGNTFHDVLVGISLAPASDGPIYAIRNLIYRTGVGNNEYSGMPFKFNSGDGDSGAMFLFHNTADAALPGNSGFSLYDPGSWTQLAARNNIWSGTDFAVYNSNASQPLDLDYDNLYTTQAGELAWWEDLEDRHLNTLAELQSATGQEMHGFSLAPTFNNAASGDYTLAANSQLLDKGLHIPGINDGYGGSAPDLGAFEFTPSLTLQGIAGNQVLHLTWEVNATLPEGATWTLTYTGPAGDEASPITGIAAATRSYTLTGLTNYAWYEISLSTAPALFNDTLRLMPTDQSVYLPLVKK